MIRFGCPVCKAVVEHGTAGDKIPCPSCGQRLQVPGSPQRTVLADALPPKDKTLLGRPPEPDGGSGAILLTTVRCHFGTLAKKFQTDRTPRLVLRAVDDMLERLGLYREDDGEVGGQVRHSYTFFCTSAARGSVRRRRDEVIVDLSCSYPWPAAAILVAILAFPVGLVLVLVFNMMAQNEVRKLVEDALRGLADDLAC